MKKNDLISGVKITDMGEGGMGVGHLDRFPLFIRHALPGDIVTAKLLKVKKTYAFARIEELEQPSPDRIPSFCEAADRCGGCQLCGLSYPAQLALKEKKLRDALIRLGGFSEEELSCWMEPLLPSGNTLRYRNKGIYPIGRSEEGRLITGFYAPRTHRIVPARDCQLAPEEFAGVIEELLDVLKEAGLSVYDEESGRGLLRHLLLRKGPRSGKLQVLFVINGDKLPREKELTDRLLSIRGITSLSLSENRRRDNVILGSSYRTLFGNERMEDSLRVVLPGGDKEPARLRFLLSPLSFYQVNSPQAEALYALALDYAGLSSGETVWDLYCGIGTISLFLATLAGRVIGIEENPAAIRDAQENARINGITNASFYAGKAEELLRKLPGEEGGSEAYPSPDVVVLDPPRAGLREEVISAVASAAPKRVVYISCNPATLSRDLKLFRLRGYQPSRIRGVDMFPQTEHVETVVLMSKAKE